MYLWNEFSKLRRRSFIQTPTGGQWVAITRCLWPDPALVPCVSSDSFSPCLLSLSYIFSNATSLNPHPPSVHPQPPTACRISVRKSPEMQLDHEEGRRISSSSSWPRCCLYRAPSPASWTRPRSYGWPSATCTCAPLSARETHPGAPWWKETATAAKVRRRRGKREK